MAALNQRKRLVSLDALRGFDMFWIIGGSSIAKGFNYLHVSWSGAIAHQLSHSKWNGFTFYDLIFPLFIYMTGISVVLSLKKRSGQVDQGSMMKHILKRTAIMFLIGIIYNYSPTVMPSIGATRIMGVLQRIALCYLFVSLMVLYTRPRSQAAAVVGILVFYWAIMRFVPVPGYGAGVWTEQGNLAGYIDNLLLPGRLYHGTWDPEGLLSTIPAFATCLLGVLSGHWLRVTEWYRGRLNSNDHALYLFLGGSMLVIFGILADAFFPINKNLWTSSYVLLTGGLSAMLLAAFYWIVDIRGHQAPAFPFILIGMNSIFIYLAARFYPFDSIASWLVSANHHLYLGSSQALIAAVTAICLEVLLVFWLYRRKIFIRI
ncbi:MAG: acyltransferase family protein [Ignavibacteriales bacterium]